MRSDTKFAEERLPPFRAFYDSALLDDTIAIRDRVFSRVPGRYPRMPRTSPVAPKIIGTTAHAKPIHSIACCVGALPVELAVAK